jgi:CDP-diacylglycerol--serine O-phosphatidyltransferase
MKKVYLIPSLLTTCNFFCGVFGLTLAFKGQYVYAAEACLVAMLFDFVDGQVARARRLSTKFGIEYDSLTDMVSFGILPTCLGYLLILDRMGRFGLGVAFLFAVCSALRLARYNAQVYREEKKCFTGLPTPAAAGLVCSFIFLAERYEIELLIKLLPFLMLGLSYLMVSTLRYPAFEGTSVRQKKPFLTLVGIVITAVIVVTYPEVSFFFLFSAYTAFGILAHFRFRRSTQWIRSVLLTAPLSEDSEKS